MCVNGLIRTNTDCVRKRGGFYACRPSLSEVINVVTGIVGFFVVIMIVSLRTMV